MVRSARVRVSLPASMAQFVLVMLGAPRFRPAFRVAAPALNDRVDHGDVTADDRLAGLKLGWPVPRPALPDGIWRVIDDGGVRALGVVTG